MVLGEGDSLLLCRPGTRAEVTAAIQRLVSDQPVTYTTTLAPGIPYTTTLAPGINYTTAAPAQPDYRLVTVSIHGCPIPPPPEKSLRTPIFIIYCKFTKICQTLVHLKLLVSGEVWKMTKCNAGEGTFILSFLQLFNIRCSMVHIYTMVLEHSAMCPRLNFLLYECFVASHVCLPVTNSDNRICLGPTLLPCLVLLDKAGTRVWYTILLCCTVLFSNGTQEAIPRVSCPCYTNV